jgi:glycerol-1-phosphate dehydrogenase [NAD(P)+]
VTDAREPDIEIDIVVGDDAVERLGAYAGAARWPRALIVMDPNTEAAAGARVARELRTSGVAVEELVLDGRGALKADEPTAERVLARLTDGVHPVAVGSGVITDVVRYAAHVAQTSFVSVPTAASMDGYASSVAALERTGVKVTLPARAPRAIFADPRVSAAAPIELTRSGIGDLLGKVTARVDWLAAHRLYGEPFSPDIADRMLEPLAFAVENAQSVLAGDPAAIRGLLGGLVQSGIAMALVGSSRPASGCEHHASHFWDLLSGRDLREHTPHGLQVGYATRFAMRLQRFAFAGGATECRRPVALADPLGPQARAWLGEPTADIVAATAEKQRFAAAIPDDWPESARAWEAFRGQLSPEVARFDRVDRALSLAGIPDQAGFLGIDEPTLRATFRYCTRLRARYTTLDFLEGQEAIEVAIALMLP